MSKSKASGSQRNRIGKFFQWMKEYKSIEVMSKNKKQIGQGWTADNPIRMPMSRVDRNDGNRNSK
jgi:hypothetical protein